MGNSEVIQSKRELEKLSSAFTLSDMEIFIFPELFFPLVLANILSPQLWAWREDPWFKGLEKKSFNYRLNRVKQYIMEHYVFNLDLDTWGLTTKEKEMDRFKDFIDIEALKQSNALFGYEGDKYYFSIDIRKHFSLDKYTDEVIPYWKTETIESMTAFKYKDGYTTGAGECVSLSALYAAALFVVGRVPLDKLFMIATPLHSQNYIAEKEGVLTNNRRLVTKNMWFNGTELSAKARRALENEQVTIVSHISGHIHSMFSDATINPGAYYYFSNHLHQFLQSGLTFEIFLSFMRMQHDDWPCFQYRHIHNGKPCYIELSTVFHYEHSSRISFASATRNALFDEIDPRDLHASPIENMVVINNFEEFLNNNPDLSFDEKKQFFLDHILPERCARVAEVFDRMKPFLKTEPRLPDTKKTYTATEPLPIRLGQTRDEMEQIIFSTHAANPMAQLTAYVYRRMDRISWVPFIKAALERNPVCIEGFRDKTPGEAFALLDALPGDSIYDSVRLALPDEVWNFNRGDGLEKAIALMNLLAERGVFPLKLSIQGPKVDLLTPQGTYSFESVKGLTKTILAEAGNPVRISEA